MWMISLARGRATTTTATRLTLVTALPAELLPAAAPRATPCPAAPLPSECGHAHLTM